MPTRSSFDRLALGALQLKGPSMSASGFDESPSPFSTLTDALRHWSDVTPDALALTAGDDVLTFSELAARVRRCSAWLADSGVNAGDRVVIVGHNTIAWVIHYVATLSLGAVIAPANNRLSPQQFADQVALLDARLVIHDADHGHIVELVSGPPILPLEHDLGSREREFSSPDLDVPALISFTSGTTGVPKGATLSQGALAQASWPFVQVMRTDATDSTLVVVPMFHNTGFIDQFGQMLLIGGRTDLLRSYRTADAIDALRTRPVTYLAAVPSLHRLMMLADGADEALGSIRSILYGGSPMPASWIQEYRDRWPGIRLFHGYGLSEYGSAISFLPSEYASTRGESVGFPVPGTEVRIVAEDGSTVAPGDVGELWAKGPTIMQGYWQQPELTADRIVDGWLRTGDLARVDDSFLYIEGRVDDVINRGGEKILPAHVEGLIAQSSGVALSTVFGVPDTILQFRVFAAVEERADGGFDESTTLASLRKVLPDYAVPERIFVQTPLPRTASGKVDRRATAALFASANTRDSAAKK